MTPDATGDDEGFHLESTSGEIDLEEFAGLTVPSLRRWISGRLQGSASNSAGDREDLPHFLIMLLYRRTPSAISRENIRIVLIGLLRDWRPFGQIASHVAVSGLLMLMPLLANSAEGEEAIEILLDSLPLLRGQDEMSRRILQALFALGYRGTEEFWEQQYQEFGAEVVPVVALALLSLDVPHALLWLDSVDDDVVANDAITALLPGVLEKRGGVEVVAAVRSVHMRLRTEFRSTVILLLKEEGIQLPSIPETVEEWEGLLEGWLFEGVARFYLTDERWPEFRSTLARFNSAPMRAAIRNLLLRWDPFGTHSSHFSSRMIDLVESSHSADTVAALIGAISGLPRVRNRLSPREWQLARRMIDVLGQHSVTLGVLNQPPDTLLWRRYADCLRLAVQFEATSLDALRQVTVHLQEHFQEVFLAALRHPKIHVVTCLEALSQVRSPDEVQLLVDQAVIAFSNRGLPDRNIAAKMVAYLQDSPNYDNPDVEEAALLLRDAATPENANSFVDRLVRESAWRPQ
jgi:hypothetical protein